MDKAITVFLDINVFVAKDYDFSEGGSLSFVKKLVNCGVVSLLMSNVVIGEVKNHITADVSGAISAIKNIGNKKIGNTDRKVKSGVKVFCDMPKYAFLFEDMKKEKMVDDAIARFDEFLVETHAVTLENSEVCVDTVLSDYFAFVPPFENNANKKSEFPDAIMSAALKKTASKENPISVVSDDKGFKKSLENVDGITLYHSLGELLNSINRKYQSAISDIITKFIYRSESQDVIIGKIFDKFESGEIDVDGAERDHHGCEVGGLDYDEIYISDVKDVKFESVSIDDISKDTALLSFSCKATVTAECTYFDESQSIWDSEEKEYAYSRYGSVVGTHNPEFDGTITLSIEDIENIGIDEVWFDITLDQYTRTEQRFVDENPEQDYQADVADALEEYHKH